MDTLENAVGEAARRLVERVNKLGSYPRNITIRAGEGGEGWSAVASCTVKVYARSGHEDSKPMYRPGKKAKPK